MMEKHIVELTTPLKGEYHEELYRRVFFVSSDILEFELLYNNGKISAIEISYKSKRLKKLMN